MYNLILKVVHYPINIEETELGDINLCGLQTDGKIMKCLIPAMAKNWNAGATIFYYDLTLR